MPDTQDITPKVSFSGNVKRELIKIPIKNNCCKKAFLSGLLYSADILTCDGCEPAVLIFFTEGAVTEVYLQLVRSFYGRDCEIKRISRAGRLYDKVIFKSKAAAGMINAFRGLAECDIQKTIGTKCDGCVGDFVRGVFCSCGTVSDPAKYFSLEFHMSDYSRTERLSQLLQECGFEPHISQMKSGYRVYFKQGNAVEDIMSLIGAQSSLFEMLNVHMIRELRSNENRATNCVTTNIQRAVSASGRQTEAITKLMKMQKYSLLSEEMRETAELRVAHPEATLSELAAMHTYPITKSGLNHRLIKLVAMADGL